jgi:S1-C subfamily serine protease
MPALLACSLVGSLFGPSQAELDATATRNAASVFTTQTAGVTATPTALPTVTPIPAPQTADQISTRLSPPIVSLLIAGSTRSGVLVEDGYVATNAHVAWPFEAVRVVFSGRFPVRRRAGTQLGSACGPGRRRANASRGRACGIEGSESLVVGSDVYLIGYPGEVDKLPQPSISRGVMSRLREWESPGLSYFQTDAAVAGGQRGGALISETGDVIGISGFAFNEADFGLVASAADVLLRPERVIAGEDTAGLGDRHLPQGPGQPSHELQLDDCWDIGAFLIREPSSTKGDFTMESLNDAWSRCRTHAATIILAPTRATRGSNWSRRLPPWTHRISPW